ETALSTHARLRCAHQDRQRLSNACPGPGRQRWRNFIPNRDLTPFKVRIRKSHSSRNEPNRSAPRQQKFHSDSFASSRHSFFCWKATSQCTSEVVLWKS